MAFHSVRIGTEPVKFIGHLGPSFSDFPKEIVVNILMRLPPKKIFVCKTVCKTWRDLIAQPDFARLHFDEAQAYPLIQISVGTKQSRILCLVQPEDEDFEPCDERVYDCPKCDCHIGFELHTGFEQVRNPKDGYSTANASYSVKRVEGNNCIESKEHKYRVVNSCNGLLCLSNPSDNSPLVVCNPVTGEFVNIPKSDKTDLLGDDIRCGFGFSPTSNQYKVVPMFQHWTTTVSSHNIHRYIGIGVEVHTLGSETWKHVDFSARKHCKLSPTYLNGFIYWLDIEGSLCMLSFDIENERFSSILVPWLIKCARYDEVSVGVLGGELSISCYTNSSETEVWVMKDDGTAKVWSKAFSLRLNWDQKIRDFFPCQQVKYLNGGAFIVLYSISSSFRHYLVYKHPRRHRIQYFTFLGEYKRLEVFSHIPSFVSLKDALSGHNVKVFKSRFTPEAEDKGIGMEEMYELKYKTRTMGIRERLALKYKKRTS